MSIKNEIKSYIVRKGFTLERLNDLVNKKNNTNYTSQNLGRKINQETIKYSEVLEIADILGYDIVWMDRK